MDTVDQGQIRGRFFEPFLSWTRPDSRWDVVLTHLPLAFVTGMILLLATWVPIDLLPLKRCTFLQLTGYPCPFCGFTRSFWAMARGDWVFAMHNCPLSCLAYIMTGLVFIWNITGLLMGVKIRRGRLLRLKDGCGRWAFYAVSGLFILNWAYRLINGLK